MCIRDSLPAQNFDQQDITDADEAAFRGLLAHQYAVEADQPLARPFSDASHAGEHDL